MEMDNTNQQAPPAKNTEQAQTPPPNPPAPSKIFIIIASVILLGMIGIGTYVLGTRKNQTVVQRQITTSPTVTQPSPSPDPTANWKIYINKTFKFQLKYPNTWFANDCNTTELLLLDPKTAPICGGGPLGYVDPIVISIYAPNKTITDYLNALGDMGIKVTLRNLQPLPNNAEKYFQEKIRPAPGVDKAVVILVPLEKAVLVINVNSLNHESVADQILSTFKFTQ